ncbi:MAG: SpoIID/LytB domain-containing protein [Caloramator sp.]|nr:SpoIID/LytB domain-containing protein [Caloramator sp.]
MRRKRKNKNPLRYIIPLTFILLSILAYFLFFFPVNIDCGLLAEKKEFKNYYRLKIVYGENIKWVNIRKKDFIEAAAYQIKLKGFRTVYFKPLKSISGKVYSKDINNLNIDDTIYKISQNINYYIKDDDNYKLAKKSFLIVGQSAYQFILDEDTIKAIILTEPLIIDKIRVGLSTYNFSSYDHNVITITSKKGFTLYSKDFQINVKKKENVTFKASGNKIKILIESSKESYQKRKDMIITDKRVFITSENPVLITSLKRENGYTPEYYGSLEIFLNDKNLRIINEVNIEDYLKYVVPSEMPGYGGIEGYKVQTVAARTYALSEILGGRFSKHGFNIDDTTQSQVYNERPTNDLCIKAIEETKGQVLTYEGKIIDAKYYSTSCGLGAAYNEVYQEVKDYNPKPYLDFNNYTDQNINGISSEEDASKFFKDWTIKAADSSSPYFRWKISIDYSTLNETINKNILNKNLKDPNSIKEKWFLNIYKKATLSENGIGKIKDIYISKRSKSGVPQEMIIVTDDKQYKIIGPSNIKYIITPKEFNIETISGLKLKNIKSLPSPFFIIDKVYGQTRLKSITIFGGGYGHGVGMSQYAAMNLANSGKTYQEILNFFYKNIKIRDVQESVKNSIK